MIPFYTGLYDNRHGYPGFFEIHRCTDCQFCRTIPDLPREKLAHVYTDYYPRRSLTAQLVLEGLKVEREKTQWNSWLEGGSTECYPFVRPGSRVLDIGCGNCSSLLKAKELGASEVLGIDVDSNLIPIAKELKLNVHIGQLADVPLEMGTFDYILCRQVIEHDPEPERMLNEMKDRLSPQGTIVLSLPNVSSFYRLIFGREWLHWHVPYHINHFSRKSIEILAHSCGLSIQEKQTMTPTMWTIQQLRQLRVSVSPGQRDTYWDPGAPASLQERPPLAERFIPARFHTRWRKWQKILIRLINLALDQSGLGECLIIVLKRNHP